MSLMKLVASSGGIREHLNKVLLEIILRWKTGPFCDIRVVFLLVILSRLVEVFSTQQIKNGGYQSINFKVTLSFDMI